MAMNEVLRDADHLGNFPVAADTPSGTPVISGALVGITQTKEGEGGNAQNTASVWTKGAHDVPVTGQVTVYGQPIYIPAAGGALTTTVGTNVLWGYALELKAAGTATITVRIARA